MSTAAPRRNIWSHTAIYGLGTVVNSAAGLVLIPLYAHLLEPSEFGVYSLVVSTGELIRVIASRGLSVAMVRMYFDVSDDGRRARVISTALLGFILLGVLVALLAWPLSTLASRMLFDSIEHRALIALAFAANYFALLFDIQLDYFRLREESRQFLLLAIVKSGWMLSMTLLFFVIMQMGVQGIVLGTLVSMASLTVGLLWFLFSRTGLGFDRALFMQMLRLGMPMIPSNVADITTNVADKYFINRFATMAMVGDYALANRVGSLLVMFVTGPFNQIWIVRRLRTLSAAEDQAALARVFTQFMAVICTASLALSLFAPEVVTVLSSGAYLGAAGLIPLTCLSFLFMPLSMNFELDLLHAKRTNLIMYANVGAAAINLLAMYLLVSRFGAVGAALAMALTNASRIAFTAAFGRWYCRATQHFDWSGALWLVGGAVGLFGLGRALAGSVISWDGALLKATLLALFIGLAARISLAGRAGVAGSDAP